MTEPPSNNGMRVFAEAMLRQYDRLVATRQNHVTGTLLVVHNYEMEALRRVLTSDPATSNG